jgi:ribonucleotide reductase alpha subunit
MAELSENAKVIAEKRYFQEGEDWEGCCKRVSTTIAQFETDKDKYSNEFYDIINNLLFLPGGRILRNAGRPRGSLFNCYVLGIGDSRKSIGKFYSDSLQLWGTGGGTGCNYSTMRPRGAEIKGVGGISSGPVSFLKASDAIAETIESGGSRRAAALGLLLVSHPDIEEFIDAKIIDKKLPHHNISVGITEAFLDAVEADADWDLIFAQQVYKTVSARKLWEKILNNNLKYAEPGLINWDNLRSNNSYYYAPPTCTNPCVTGETLVHVADGRSYIPIKQLAEEKKDVPVFSFNEKTKDIEVRMMRHPRITGYNKKILKITLDDGSSIRCTEDHKLYLKNLTLKEAKDLKVGDRLQHAVVKQRSYNEVYKNITEETENLYSWIYTNNSKSPKAEHRLIANELFGDFGPGYAIHHKDSNGLNNNPDNLQVLKTEEHIKLHMVGNNNPMNRFPERNWLIKQDWSGEKNGRYKGFTPEEVYAKAVDLTKKTGRRVTQEEWNTYCKEVGLPDSKYSFGNFTSLSKMLYSASLECGLEDLKYSSHIREYKRFLKLLDETDLSIFFEDGSIYVKKVCEYCNKDFIVKWGNREVCFCSSACASRATYSNKEKALEIKEIWDRKQFIKRQEQIKIFDSLKEKLKREPYKKEWEEECKLNGVAYRIRDKKDKNASKYCFFSYRELKEAANLNFKVIKIEEDGYEDVYNGTVDENHNFYIKVNSRCEENGRDVSNCILSRNCGETVLSPGESCDLGSLVLPNFIFPSGKTNWKKMEEVIGLAVRFLDDVIDINRYELSDVASATHNSRRQGLGVMGLADYLFSKKVRYGSDKSLEELEKLFKFIRNCTYTNLVKLSSEKGAFPKFDPQLYSKAHFIRTLPPKLRLDIKKFGVRCVSGLALAPTGTISLIADTTSGIEPLFRKAYKRSDRVSERIYIHPFYEELIKGGQEIPEWFVDSNDLKPEDHLNVQVTLQPYIDNAISKTVNLPKSITVSEISDLLLETLRDLKGVTLYVDGSREGQILNSITSEEVVEFINSKKHSNDLSEKDVACAGGSCEL